MKKFTTFGIATTIAIGLLCTSAQSQELSVETIMNAHIKALGGMEALDKIKTIKRSGSASISIPTPMEGPYEAVLFVGEKFSQKWEVPGAMSTVTTLIGTAGWMDHSMLGLAELEGDLLKAIMSQLYVSEIASVWREKGNDSIRLLPDETLESTTYHVVQIVGEEEIKFYLDRESMLLAHWIANQGNVETALSFYDYASHGGVQMPGAATSKFMYDFAGRVILEMRFEKVTINGDVDDTVFEPPEGIEDNAEHDK